MDGETISVWTPPLRSAIPYLSPDQVRPLILSQIWATYWHICCVTLRLVSACFQSIYPDSQSCASEGLDIVGSTPFQVLHFSTNVRTD